MSVLKWFVIICLVVIAVFVAVSLYDDWRGPR